MTDPAPLREAIARLENVSMGSRVADAYSVFPNPHATYRGDLRAILAALPTDAVQPVGGAMAFGAGRFVVDTGSYQQTPAVFICPVEQPGEVGASARHLGHDRHTLLPGERVLTFPTFDQAQAVADALVNATAPTAGSGWVMVPREPTEAMIRGGLASDNQPSEGQTADLIANYRAMITAAPTVGGE
jgi:hypothetical protein